MFDCIAIGTGAAGLSAAIYGGRYRMSMLVIGENFGGYTSIAGEIENYPGFSSVDGYELMKRMKEQAEGVGATIVDGRVTSIARDEGGCFRVMVGEKEYFGRTVVFGTGSKRRQLGLPNENELTSKGVHYCMTCDAPVYRDKVVAVVGGGDASVKGTLIAAEYAKKIYFIVRSDKLRAEPINQDALMKLGDKVEILYETNVTALIGEKRLEKITLSKPYNGLTEMTLDGLFIEIGATPVTDLITSLGIALDAQGYVIVDPMMHTNVEGGYAAGDIMNLFGHFKQDITAAATGALAATSAYEYVKSHGELCVRHARSNGA